MPRRSGRNVQLLIESTNAPVSDHLRDEYWRLKKAAKEEIDDCPVCLDACTCRKCMLLMSCGHSVCASCYLKMQDPRCAVCRQ